MKKRIVVCGATGTLGGAIVRALLREGNWTVVALTRDPSSRKAGKLAALGADVFQADPNDLNILCEAFSGAYAVFGLTQAWDPTSEVFDTSSEMRQGKNIIWAARLARVPEVVFSTIMNIKRERARVPYIDAKLQLESVFRTVIPHGVLLKPSLFMQNFDTPLLRYDGRQIFGRFPKYARIPFVAPDDIGDCVSKILLSPERYRGKEFTLVGDTISGSEIAELISEITGQDIRYKQDNPLCLWLKRPRLCRMRRYFVRQAMLYKGPHIDEQGYFMISPGATRMIDFLRDNIAIEPRPT